MKTNRSSSSICLRPGMPVEVVTHYTGAWTGGFEVAALDDETCRLRRVSDGVVLPVEFDCAEVRAASGATDVGELIDRFAHATRSPEIEAIADELGATGDPRAVRSLLGRLGDVQVQEDSDVEDSVCRALVALGVMRAFGNLSFAFVPRCLLPPDVVEMIEALGPAVPMRYVFTRQA